MVAGVPAAETWKTALDKYRYLVDLKHFTGTREHQNWFNLENRPGDRLQTMGFEARFREHAGHHLEVWGEVVFWKLYTMGLVRNGTTQKVLDLGVPPDELWSACTDYIENGSKESFRTFRSKLFPTSVVATAATFPAFICPERFPMVDKQITRWASKNGHLHRYSGVGGGRSRVRPGVEAGRPHGKSLAVHSILDRLVSIHRAGATAALFQSVDPVGRRLTGRALSRRLVLAMIKRRAAAADLPPSTCCHTFRATGITAYLSNGGTLEHAQQIAGHASPKTTKLYDRTADTITVDEIERIVI